MDISQLQECKITKTGDCISSIHDVVTDVDVDVDVSGSSDEPNARDRPRIGRDDDDGCISSS